MDAIANANRQHLAQLIAGAIQDHTSIVRNSMDLVRLAMVHVETIKGLTGSQKLRLVLDVLMDISKGADGVVGTLDDLIPRNTRYVLATLIDTGVLPSIIETTIAASKGLLNLNVKRGCKWLCCV